MPLAVPVLAAAAVRQGAHGRVPPRRQDGCPVAQRRADHPRRRVAAVARIRADERQPHVWAVAGHAGPAAGEERGGDRVQVRRRRRGRGRLRGGRRRDGLRASRPAAVTAARASCGSAASDHRRRPPPPPTPTPTTTPTTTTPTRTPARSLQLWRFVTPIFLHAGVIHIASNLVMQLRLGLYLEIEWGSLAFAQVSYSTVQQVGRWGRRFRGSGRSRSTELS